MAPCPRLGGLECESEEGCALGSCVAIALCSCLCVWPSPASSCLHFPAPMRYNLGLQVKHSLLPFDFFLPGYFYHNNRYNTRTVSQWTWSSLIHTDTLAQWALRTLLPLPPPPREQWFLCAADPNLSAVLFYVGSGVWTQVFMQVPRSLIEPSPQLHGFLITAEGYTSKLIWAT